MSDTKPVSNPAGFQLGAKHDDRHSLIHDVPLGKTYRVRMDVWGDDHRERADAIVAAVNAATYPSPKDHSLPIGDNHPDALAVDRFAAAMKAKLAAKRAEGRSGWDDKDDCSQLFLSQLLREHVEKGDPLDVGNFAMMLHQREERIASLLETLQGE
ncbi:hypothetical protein [Neorhizobium alkalisoli]|uniref:Uncharacterized protein n=1 Tax=Neorhizobium alkalisoli TaxID=528178 RepID=A0A561QS63_9HYPH|nr:hypothetical protein [Neorhizobium alkalisoli]TWF53235.1 hypothetical protein FHW37_104512 [Neorhizobium alkalisoli]